MKCKCGCGKEATRIKKPKTIYGYESYYSLRFIKGHRVLKKRYVRKDGYIEVLTDKGIRTFEHRVEMEKKLGRKLRPNEVVHHVDHDKGNNNPSNLVVYKNLSEHIKKAHSLGDKTYQCKQCGKEKIVPFPMYYQAKKNKTKHMEYCSRKCFFSSLRGKPFSGIPGHPRGGYR